MKLIILPLLIASIGIAEANVYKCPGAVAGRYTYQEKPCSNVKGASEKNKVEIVPTNKKKVEAAVEKLNNDLKAYQAKKEQEAKAKDKTQTEINVTLPTKEDTATAPETTTKTKSEEPADDANNEGS